MGTRISENIADIRTSLPLEQRLVEALWQLWETEGHAAISARSLAQHAGLPMSTLYNRFPSMEQVFLTAQEEALTQTRQWCAQQLEHLSQPGHPLPVGGLGTIMAALIDEWAQHQRRLAFAWREGFLLASRDPGQPHPGREWHGLWRDFWHAVCALCGMEDYGEWTSFIFEAEAALHMLRWRRTLDRACLEELCHSWEQWLQGRLVPPCPWRSIAREQALASLPDLPRHDETTRRIAEAAADVVEHQGIARLTHRSVAAAAGVTLGMVSSRFRTSVDLVKAAFEAIYQRAASPYHKEPDTAAPGTEESLEQLIPKLTGEHISVSNRLAFEELALAVARDPNFQPFAPQLRYLRGRTSRQVLDLLMGSTAAISPDDAALFSDFLSGMQRAGITLPPAERARSGRAHIERLHRLLSGQEAGTHNGG
ncbi:TetR family transcriptional regulator [Novosphingobium sp.]|uniref:TetR family transcriptional regulator n=1 Tax=Novosphingobium sp. TaxID=1874826 RepID=UPI0031D21B5D